MGKEHFKTSVLNVQNLGSNPSTASFFWVSMLYMQYNAKQLGITIKLATLGMV